MDSTPHIWQINWNMINRVYRPYLDDETYIQIFYGGSSSGKSYFLAQRCVIDMLRGGHNYLCCRKVARTIKKSIYNEVKKAITALKADDWFKFNESDLVITCRNGYQILFVGLDDVEKVKSITPAQSVVTDIWVEEATEASYDDIAQLRKRMRGRAKVKKRVTLSFNPIYKTHWIFTEFFAGKWSDDSTSYRNDTLSILKTTYLDNQFLAAEDKAELEGEKNPYYKDVYTLGNWGVLGDVIFNNWHTEDLSRRVFDNICCGVDFGYARDPAAVVRVAYDRMRSTVYILNAEYVFGATNDILAATIKQICGYETVCCDEAEPKSIQELRNFGVRAIPAPKGGGHYNSILFGIQWLQRQNIVIDSSLMEAINEFIVYTWQKDKEGNTIPKPIDKNNHILDAIRYALVYEMGWLENRANSNIKMPLAGAM